MELELYDKNLIKATNTRVIPVAAYPIDVMKFSLEDVKGMDMSIKLHSKELQSCPTGLRIIWCIRVFLTSLSSTYERCKA